VLGCDDVIGKGDFLTVGASWVGFGWIIGGVEGCDGIGVCGGNVGGSFAFGLSE